MNIFLARLVAMDYNIFFSLGHLDYSIDWTIEWMGLLTPFDANVEKWTLPLEMEYFEFQCILLNFSDMANIQNGSNT